MSTTLTTADAQHFLAAVAQQLADLRPEDRTELLEDLGLHLADLGAEDDDRPLAVRLGQPVDYARELRAAADLPVRREAPASRLAALRRRAESLSRQAPVRESWQFLFQLRPGWWVLRGYLVVLLACLHSVDSASDFPIPAPLGSHALGTMLVALVVVASVLLGRRRPPRPLGAVVITLNVLLALSTFHVAASAPDRLRVTLAPQSTPFAYSPLASVNGPILNIYPYTAAGDPLQGVLLYDQDGRPLHTRLPLWWADSCPRLLAPPLALDGVPVTFSFPQTYQLDPTRPRTSGLASPAPCAVSIPRPAVPLPVFGTAPASPSPTPLATP